MGTRNLTCAMIDGEYKVAQYGQWDGYPSGVGITILEFLRDKMNRSEFEKRLREVSFYTKDDINNLGDNWPKYLSRDVAGDILEVIQTGVWETSDFDTNWVRCKKTYECKVEKLSNSIDFAGDSLFCEWGYVVDFDKNTFEVYEGFVKSPHTGERFSDIPCEKEHRGEQQYYPIKLVKTFDLNNLPSNDEFLKEFEENEENED